MVTTWCLPLSIKLCWAQNWQTLDKAESMQDQVSECLHTLEDAFRVSSIQFSNLYTFKPLINDQNKLQLKLLSFVGLEKSKIR